MLCRPQSVSELGNCIFQLLATLIFISIIQPYFLAGDLFICVGFEVDTKQMLGVELMIKPSSWLNPILYQYAAAAGAVPLMVIYYVIQKVRNLVPGLSAHRWIP